MSNLQQLDAMKKRLQDLRQEGLLQIETENSIREKFIIDWTYHSNAIEGNSLSWIETKVVLENGITVGGKTLKEHLEAIDHKGAILFLEELVAAGKQLSERNIQEVHAVVLSRIAPNDSGRYRSVPVRVGQHVPPQPWEVPIQMERLMKRYHEEWTAFHPIKRAAYWHCEFVRIHPFVDGNGRTARLVMNLELMKEGYPPIIIPVEDRFRYYEVLQKYDETGNAEDFLEMLLALEEESFAVYLELFDGQS